VALVAVLLLLTACGQAGGGNASGGDTGGGDASSSAGGDAAAEDVPGVTEDEILIAGFGPLTGPASWIGLGTRDGLAMGFEEINENGGVHGRMLRLEWFDDQYEVAQAQTVIRRIVGDVEPFLVYSGTGSTVAVSVMDSLRESGIPAYNGFSGSPLSRKDEEAPNLFHGQAVSATWVIEDLMRLLEDLEVERVSVLHDVGEWGRSVCEPAIEALESDLGITPDTIQTYAVGDTDFTGQLIALRDADPQVIINCGHYPEAAVILSQARELGLDALFVGDTAQGNNSVWTRAGQAAENFIFNWYSPVFLTDPEGPMADFREKYEEQYPDAPEGRPAHSDTFAYGDAFIIAEALERAGENPTRESFQEAMKSLTDFQPTPINATANFDNPQNDGFQETVWMRVQDGQAVLIDDEQLAELREVVAGL
jgi:ABC-type branched-subunit amino acid transport system substrate-binding protein